jgi:DNA topoisomerase-1
MTKTLVIVESPGKIAKIGQYLGADYIVKASFGHVQDLDKTTLSIDVENNFKPYYIISPDKTKVVKELKSLVKECSDVILAADGDREGEAIAYSLASVLELKNPKRIIFHEITKNALTKAVQSPTVINYDMVHAQQARRLLDRLVGYQISPVLWKYMVYNGTAQSAGRVQSVVVRIIIDKENEITKSISEPYFKTTAEFEFQEDEKSDKIKLNSSLNIGTKLYQFESEESAKQFMSLVNKKTDFKVVLVDNKKSIRKPSAPFITSSLQQEASTKLHFSVKKTMDVAQKLYEAGLITYMRSDSPNISKEAIKEAEVYITKTYGKEYSDSKNYESKSSNSQDAHECIRPTHIDKPEPENIDGEQAKLYSLIWKRTMASQMANAQINIQTIQIDCINNKSSILIFNNTQAYFTSTLENVEFPGYLIVYDNSPEDEEKTSGKLAIKPKDKLNLNKLKVCEEYTKPPLRYNEAALVKYLEKNGIGRPSTYASIISKVIERQYVEIKNIDGVKKQSKQFELDSKFKIKESVKEISIGKETKKLVPTHLGNQINDFMMKYFEQIMDIEFTANFETYLDKIAEGKANWVTVLKTFY